MAQNKNKQTSNVEAEQPQTNKGIFSRIGSFLFRIFQKVSNMLFEKKENDDLQTQIQSTNKQQSNEASHKEPEQSREQTELANNTAVTLDKPASVEKSNALSDGLKTQKEQNLTENPNEKKQKELEAAATKIQQFVRNKDKSKGETKTKLANSTTINTNKVPLDKPAAIENQDQPTEQQRKNMHEKVAAPQQKNPSPNSVKQNNTLSNMLEARAAQKLTANPYEKKQEEVAAPQQNNPAAIETQDQPTEHHRKNMQNVLSAIKKDENNLEETREEHHRQQQRDASPSSVAQREEEPVELKAPPMNTDLMSAITSGTKLNKVDTAALQKEREKKRTNPLFNDIQQGIKLNKVDPEGLKDKQNATQPIKGFSEDVLEKARKKAPGGDDNEFDEVDDEFAPVPQGEIAKELARKEAARKLQEEKAQPQVTKEGPPPPKPTIGNRTGSVAQDLGLRRLAVAGNEREEEEEEAEKPIKAPEQESIGKLKNIETNNTELINLIQHKNDTNKDRLNIRKDPKPTNKGRHT